jgi:hypothetical protein
MIIELRGEVVSTREYAIRVESSREPRFWLLVDLSYADAEAFALGRGVTVRIEPDPEPGRGPT